MCIYIVIIMVILMLIDGMIGAKTDLAAAEFKIRPKFWSGLIWRKKIKEFGEVQPSQSFDFFSKLSHLKIRIWAESYISLLSDHSLQ